MWLLSYNLYYKNKKIYVWGYNNYGQLGIGDNKNRNIPTLLNLPNK